MIAEQVRADQVRALYRQSPIVLTANCVNTALVAALTWNIGQRALVSVWMALTLLVTAARLWLFWRYRRATPDAKDAPLWGRRFVWGSALSGLLWGGASVALLQGADASSQLVVIFFAGGMCAAAAASLASHLPAFVAFASPTLAALIWGMTAFGDALHRVMAVVLSLYAVGLFGIARVNHRSLTDAFSLRFENAELLIALERSQRQLQENNRTLEQRVAERGEALQRQAEALRDAQRLEAVGRLAGGIAHDFNNLLTVLLANISELSDDPKLDANAKSGLREMHEAATRGADLVRQLMAFGRQQHISPEQLDLNLLVTNMQKWVGRLLGETLTLQVELQPEPLFVRMDPSQTEQVIVNLVTNARDAVAGGGTVSIEARAVTLPDAEEGLPAGRYAMLSVTDTGVGMDAETRRRIFEPFFTTKQIGKGTGLGLATVHGIVEQAGGKVLVTSELGRGSSFRVYLPLTSAPESALPTFPVTSSGLRPVVKPAHAFTILLVEDEPAIRGAAVRALKRAGFRVLSAESGEAALSLSRELEGPLDLLITDVVMGGMTGPDLAAQLSVLRPEMRTLFISGHIGESVLPIDDDASAAAFLAKPFTSDMLIVKVTELLALTPRLSEREVSRQ